MDTTRVEIGNGGVIELLKALLGTRRSVEPGGEAPHKDEKCECPGCRLARYEMPVALTAGDELNDRMVDELKSLIDTGERTQEAATDSQKLLCLQPLPTDVERILMQYRVDRLGACVRAQDALIALLPEDRQPPKSIRLKAMPVERAMSMLDEARVLIRTELAQKKAAAEAVADVGKTVDEAAAAAAAPTAEASNG